MGFGVRGSRFGLGLRILGVCSVRVWCVCVCVRVRFGLSPFWSSNVVSGGINIHPARCSKPRAVGTEGLLISLEPGSRALIYSLVTFS